MGTLTLGKKLNQSNFKSGGVAVEIIKSRRVKTQDEKAEEQAASPASSSADKLKAILEKAKAKQAESHAKSDTLRHAEEARRAAIEAEPAGSKDFAEPSAPVAGEKKYKKEKPGLIPDDGESLDKKRGKTTRSKINFADVIVSSSDLDELDEENKADGSRSLESAMDIIGTRAHRRSVASIKRQREKNYRKFVERTGEGQPKEPAAKTSHEVVLPETISVKDLASRMAEKSSDVVKTMMKLGIMATINQIIDADTAELVVMEMGHTAKRVADSDVETAALVDAAHEEKLETRAPVVTVMGHVDHGKTSLLDALRQTDVVSGEAGGITQHIGAYQITSKSGRRITFIDTPGHEAFSAMRARGASITDIVVLVVAANDSIMPQTIEAINHAKAGNVPMIVAINKIDLPEANANKVRQDLLQHSVVVEEMGGQTLNVEISAKQKIGLEKLEELILLQADMLELKGDIAGRAQGAVIEAKQEQGRGTSATILVQKGVLRKGDVFVSGASVGHVRDMLDEHGNRVSEAYPSRPVVVLGFDTAPVAGDDFVVVESDAKAREVADYRKRKLAEKAMVKNRSSWQELFMNIKEGRAQELPVIIKADTQGSAEAIADSLKKIPSEKVKVRVMHSAIGGVNESDITLAKTTGSAILAFNVRASAAAREAAKASGVDIRYYSIIYDMVDDVKVLMSGLLAPVMKEVFIGYADVIATFAAGKVKVAGCRVTEGVIKKGAGVRMLRNDIVIYEGKLAQLKRGKDDAKEARSGVECGVSFDNWGDIEIGDRLECFETEAVKQEI